MMADGGLRLRPSGLPEAADAVLWQFAWIIKGCGPGTDTFTNVLTCFGRGFDDADLMWVSGDMTSLAVHTAREESLPEVSFPASSGMMFFDGGFVFRGGDSPAPRRVYGLVWAVYGGRPHVVALDDGRGMTARGNVPLGLMTDVDGFLVRVLRAVMALVEAREEESVAPADVRRVDVPGAGERRVSPVRVVTVREHVESTGKRGGRHRSPAYRFIVSGFWRNQPYGEGRRLRKRIWVAPYVRGPADRPLVVRDTVRTLR